MGELQVWVNGIINTISDVEDSTTCRDTVVALAQSFSLTGRFNLIEKSPTSERCLHPSERPLKIREKWGQGSANYFVLRKRSASPSSSRPSSSAASSCHSSPLHAKSSTLRPVESISETGGHSREDSAQPVNPPALKPKPKPKPKPILPAPSKEVALKQSTDVQPKAIPRAGKSVPIGTDDVQLKASLGQELSHQPDLLVRAPNHPSIGHRASEEIEIMKQHEERAEALEHERERLQQVEIALQKKRKQRTLEQPGGVLDSGPLETEQQKILQDFKWKQAEARKKDVVREASWETPGEEEIVSQERREPESKQGQGQRQEVLEQKPEVPTGRKNASQGKDKYVTKKGQTTKAMTNSDRKMDAETKVEVPSVRTGVLQGGAPEDSLKVKRAKEGRDGRTRKSRKRDDKTKREKKVQDGVAEEADRPHDVEEEKRELEELVRAQECKLNHQKTQLSGLDVAIQALLKFESDPAIRDIQEEVADIEKAVQRNQAILNEREFWENELELEREMHRKLEASVGELKDKVADCNRQISQKCAEISKLSDAIGKEERKLGLDDVEETIEVRAVKDELIELKVEYEVITENLKKVNVQLEELDKEFQEKQKELNLVKEDYEKAKEVEIEIIIPDNRAETEETTDRKEKGEIEEHEEVSSPNMPHRILKTSPRELAQATPTSDNPEGVFL